MPNVLDAAPVRAFALRASAIIPVAAIAARFEKLVFGRMLEDERNFRAAGARDVRREPVWALEALARGEPVSVFCLHPGAAARVRMVARRIAQTCSLAALDPNRFPAHLAAMAQAGAFLDKFGRVDFDTAARKALAFARVYAIVEDDLDCELAAPAAEIPGISGHVWRRVRSVSELRQIGREFHNCLARTPRHASYGAMISRGSGQFWVLRDAAGAGLIVALAPLPNPARFSEVRGPRNAAIAHDNADLALLAQALGAALSGPRPHFPRADADIEAMLEWLRNENALVPPLRRQAGQP